ncbi:hypothetical protein ACNKHN_23230 [Shigella flexneri]
MGVLVNTLCSFKRHYDANTPLAQVMPELVEQYPDTYANIGIHNLGDQCFLAKENNPGARLNEAYSGLPVAEITRVKRTTRCCDNNVELVSIENLQGRIRSKLSYPVSAGIPMFCCLVKTRQSEQYPQVRPLRSLQ